MSLKSKAWWTRKCCLQSKPRRRRTNLITNQCSARRGKLNLPDAKDETVVTLTVKWLLPTWAAKPRRPKLRCAHQLLISRKSLWEVLWQRHLRLALMESHSSPSFSSTRQLDLRWPPISCKSRKGILLRLERVENSQIVVAVASEYLTSWHQSEAVT